jgi:tRNA (cmo5U34)-methyltransferase
MSQYHFHPDGYLERIRADVPRYDELQQAVADASVGVGVTRILDLGVGTGQTAKLVLRVHPQAKLVGIDESEEMLAAARGELAGELRVARLEEPLPEGPFDLVVSCLAIHHLDGGGKRNLFRRLATVLRPGGRFVLGDLVVPEQPDDVVTPATPDFDRPDRLDDQLRWLEDAGFEAQTTWAWKDLAVIRADRRS